MRLFFFFLGAIALGLAMFTQSLTFAGHEMFTIVLIGGGIVGFVKGAISSDD
jgi:hypothetical protein